MERKFDIYAVHNANDGERVFAALEIEGRETIVASTESELKQALVELTDPSKDKLKFNRARQEKGSATTITKGDDVFLVRDMTQQEWVDFITSELNS